MKKIFDGIFDDEVHANFLKFGKGDYKNKYFSQLEVSFSCSKTC